MLVINMVFSVFVGRVEDYDKWQPTLIEDSSIIKDNSGKSVRVLRGSEDSNRVIVIIEFEDMEKAKVLVESDFLKERFKAGGIIGTPEIYFVDEITNTIL